MSGSSPGGSGRPAGNQARYILERSVLGGVLVMAPGILGYLAGNLWLFPSLGPSIFLLPISPGQKTARTYNTFTGHLIAIVRGYAAVLVTGAAGVPSVLVIGHLLVPHVVAASLAVTVMMKLQLLVRAIHPPRRLNGNNDRAGRFPGKLARLSDHCSGCDNYDYYCRGHPIVHDPAGSD
jgi:hypothetical protein